MLRTSTSRLLPYLALTLAVSAPLACGTNEDGDAPETEPKSAEAPDPAPTTPAKVTDTPATPTPEPAGGMGTMIAQGMDSITGTGGRLDRGNALAHFVLPNPAKFLSEVRTQAAPSKGAAILNEAALRTMSRMVLGSRSGLADNLSLDGPMGCVLVDDPSTEVPVACTVAYKGGAAAAVTDLGAEGKEGDAQGHLAHYRVEGQDLYVDDLDGQVVVTNHPAVFAKAKDYIATNMLGRAESIPDDVEMVMYPKAGMTRYSKQIDSVFSALRSAPGPSSSNPLAGAFTDYSHASMDRTLDYYRELDQVGMGFGLEEVGFVLRYAVFPTPGSGTQSDTQAIASGAVDLSLVQQMPAASWMLSASTVDWKAAWGLESAATMRDALIEAYATGVGNDAATVRSSIEAFLDENAGVYDDDMAVAIVHLPGTQGGIVVSRKLAAPARDRWKPWTERFTPEAVLGTMGLEHVTWSFQSDALEVDGVAVDRWTIEPGPSTKAEIATSTEPVVAEIERRFGGLKLEIDRVELSDRVLFVMAPGSQEKYIRAAVEATKSGGAGTDAGLSALLARNPDTSAIAAFNVAGAMSWAREVLPPEATRKLPAALGKDLGDFYFSATYGSSGAQHGEMVLSQSMIDELRAFAE